MSTVRATILNAVAAADSLHRAYGTERLAEQGIGRIDVFRMLFDRSIPLLFRPLSGLLGAYLPDPQPGVLITTQRPLAVQRLTAAHELGHAILGHLPSLDDEGMLTRSPFITPQYDLQEIAADAFAFELLMPLWLLAKEMLRQGWSRDDLVRPEITYQLSLRLGVSYRATCFALQRHGAIDAPTCKSLVSVEPRQIKERLAQGIKPSTWHGDVWIITGRDQGILVEGSRSDLVILKLFEHSGAGYIWRFDELSAVGLKVLDDRRIETGEPNQVGEATSRRITSQPEDIARGHVTVREIRPWLPRAEPLHSLEMKVDLHGPIERGLLELERGRLLGAA